MTQRAQGFDNLKALLIFLVVLGHGLECCPGWDGLNSGLYRLIYSFHMPAFLFLSGWFARLKPRDLTFRLAYLYLLFQVLYQLFGRFVLQSAATPLQITTPHWLLWYLLVLIFCHLLLPLLEVSSPRRKGAILLCCVAIALVSGLDESIGYYLSLGRLCSFLPYFVLGHYAGQWHQRQTPAPSLKWTAWSGLGVLVASILTWTMLPLSRKVLWGAEGFEDIGVPWWTEMAALAVALVWITFLIRVLLPLLNRPIPLMTALGRGTLPVFLLHGFVIQWLKHHQILAHATPFHVLGLSLGLVAILGNPLTARLFQRICTGWWLEKLWNKL